MKKEFLKKYASLVVNFGVKIQKNNRVLINTTVEDYPLAKLIAIECYEKGALYVELSIIDQEILKYRFDNQNLEEISYLPDYKKITQHVLTTEKWIVISIANTSQDGVTNSVDPSKLQKYAQNISKNNIYFTKARMSNKIPWIVIASPNIKWAKKIYGQSSQENLDKLIGELVKILRLDEKDPVQAWEKHSALLKNRAEKINSFQLDYLHFESKNTDLKVWLNPSSHFVGASSTTDYGHVFFPNMPTEEIFTTPDWRKTTGKVSVCKPVQIYGNTVEDIKLEFKDGKVVSYLASTNEHLLTKFLETDEGAKFLGEVALVDINSPIYRSGLVFSNILYDENSSSHIAIGRGYPFTLDGADKLESDADLKNIGCNVSSVHTDFMIGDERTSVTGYKKDGTKISIMNNGLFDI